MFIVVPGGNKTCMIEYNAVAKKELALVCQGFVYAIMGLAFAKFLDPLGRILAVGRALFH